MKYTKTHILAADVDYVAETGRPIAQRQDSLSEQLDDLQQIALALGMYDAADYLERKR
jgi:hypothetical protein